MTQTRMYKFLCEDSNYSEWSILDEASLEEVFHNKKSHYTSSIVEKFSKFNPVQHRLFNQDVFLFDDIHNIKLQHSTLKTMKYIPGVLKLEGNQTYGKCKDKYYYRCFPDDKRFPEFLVPYKITKKSFSKKQINIFVLFTFKEWMDKHPIGTLCNTIGTVDILVNFYEYQLYCKSLYASIQDFKKATVKALKQRSEEEYISDIKENNNVEDRQDWKVFSIDPLKSKDFDDAFSVKEIQENKYLVSIYISNVALWMESMQLWDSFSERISTIYLPDQKRPMLPTILSDCLCSLVENEQRFAFTMDLIIINNKITDVSFKNTLIKVYKNFRYEEKELTEFQDYKILFDLTIELRKQIKNFYKIKDSHDVVGFLMVLMNYYSAMEMMKHNSGIYRSVKLTSEVRIPDDLPESVFKFLKGWNSTGGKYLLFDDMEKHEILNLDSYIHITSPIRRLVDLLNIIQFQHNNKLVAFTDSSKAFYDKWMSRISYINTTMRSIRRVQCDCSLLDLCVNKPEFMEKIYTGYMFDRIVRTDGLYQVFVHIPEINMTTRYTSIEELEDYKSGQFKLYLFKDEHNIKQKIRLMIV